MLITVLTLLGLLECPPADVLLRAAERRLGGDDTTIEEQVARVRARHWLPLVNLRGFVNDTASQPLSDVSTTGVWRNGVGVDLRLVFHLPDLVYDDHETALRREALQSARERRELARSVIALTQRLLVLRDELRVAPDAAVGEVFSDSLMVWLELDALTGGACRAVVKGAS